jgi:hypothetical protein
MSFVDIDAVAWHGRVNGRRLSLAEVPPQALSLTFVDDEQDIPTPLDERHHQPRSYVTTQHEQSEPLHERYSSHNVSHFPFQHITAFRADMTQRLETLETHALNFYQRLNTIRQGIATLNERSTTADGPLNTIRQSLLLPMATRST